LLASARLALAEASEEAAASNHETKELFLFELIILNNY
jgi:hypothetical protein